MKRKVIALVIVLFSLMISGSVFAEGYLVTSDLWIRAVINTVEKGPIEAVWQKGGEDTTSRGDRVIWGHFYASPDDVTWGSENNPDLFVKIWFDVSGRVDINYFHVSVPDIEVYSDYPYDGTTDEQGTTTMSRRYIRQYYENGQSNSDENYEDGNPPSGYLPAGNPFGYSTINDLRIGSIINTVEKGPIDAVWRLGGQDTTSRGDQVVWGHFYASPTDVTWGSQNNPDLFVKIWFDVSGRIDVNFFHVSVPNIEVCSDFPNDSNYDTRGTTIMDNRYIRHEYWALSPSPPLNPTFNGIAASWTDNDNYAALAVHENGERLVAMTNEQSVTGAVWTSPSSDSFVVYRGIDGLPERAVIGDYVFLFENYTSNTVDVAVVYPDGSINITRDVPVDSDQLSQLRSGNTQLRSGNISTLSFTCEDLVQTLRVTSFIVSTAACAAAYMTGVGVPVGLACTAALVSSVRLLLPEDNVALAATSTSLGAIGCGIGDTAACASLIIDITADVVDVARTSQELQATGINLAESSLIYGGGDVQVTLTWDNDADLDLWVTDPYGESIGYSSMTSASGGQLDVDDRDGFGPENIFWPSGEAPDGTYTVEIHYYSGSGTANYQVLVQVNGASDTYAGSLTLDERISVTSFDNGTTVPAPFTETFSDQTEFESNWSITSDEENLSGTQYDINYVDLNTGSGYVELRLNANVGSEIVSNRTDFHFGRYRFQVQVADTSNF